MTIIIHDHHISQFSHNNHQRIVLEAGCKKQIHRGVGVGKAKMKLFHNFKTLLFGVDLKYCT